LSFFILQVPQVKKAKDFFTDKLHTRAVEVREAKEAVESARASLLPQKGDVRKKSKEKKKTKEGGLPPQEGDVRKIRKEKKRKRPRKARRWLLRRQGSVCHQPRIPFFCSRVFGF
jgi:hypothetical protein